MPFSRPTLSELKQQVAAGIDAELPGVDALLRFSNLAILAKVFAGGLWGQYGYLDWIARQAVPYTCEDEYLEAWAALKNISRKGPAVAAGAAQFSGSPGVLIPDTTPLTRSDGVAYVTVGDSTVNGSGQATVSVAAALQITDLYGSAWNAPVGTSLTLGVALAGVTSTGAVSTAIAGGTDIETDDELRARMLEAFAHPPQGGAKTDYVEWATAIAGVTRAWCYPLEQGAGTVTVRFMMDDVHAGTGGFPVGTNGVAAADDRDAPATGDQLTVANAIFDLQPVTALIYVVAPVANPVAFTIAGLSTAPVGVQNAVTAAIAGVFASEGEPGGTVDVSLIEKAIGAVAGTDGFVITAITPAHGSVTPGSAGNIISAGGYLPTLGAVTFA